VRKDPLNDHDGKLRDLGVSEVCLNADFVISNIYDREHLANEFSKIVDTLTQDIDLPIQVE